MAPEQRLIELPDGRRLGLRCWSGSGLPVVLIHGLLDSSAGWNRLASGLPNPCIAPDLPGFGQSDMPTTPRLSAYADDVVDALYRLDIERFILVGHSLGGAVAGAIADSYQDRIVALALIAPAGFGRIRAAEALSRPGARRVVGGVLPLAMANPVFLTGLYMTVVTNGSLPESEFLQRLVRRVRVAGAGAQTAARAVVAAGRSPDGFSRRGLPYRGPARVLWGDHDRLVHIGHVSGVRAALPQAQVEVWPGMGHHPQRERPRDLARFIGDLCAEAMPLRATRRARPAA